MVRAKVRRFLVCAQQPAANPGCSPRGFFRASTASTRTMPQKRDTAGAACRMLEPISCSWNQKPCSTPSDAAAYRIPASAGMTSKNCQVQDRLHVCRPMISGLGRATASDCNRHHCHPAKLGSVMIRNKYEGFARILRKRNSSCRALMQKRR